VLLEGPGTWRFTVGRERSHSEFACVTSSGPAEVLVQVDGDTVDHVYLSGDSTHTWWTSNPLLCEAAVDGVVEIQLVGKAAMRLEWPSLKLNKGPAPARKETVTRKARK